MKYSLIVSGEKFKENLSQLSKILSAGIKVFAFTEANADKKLENLQHYRNFRLFVLNNHQFTIPSLYIEDGLIPNNEKSSFEELCKQFPSFDKNQYNVEHFGINNTLIVKAGAGTGKTTVMIDRILYLLAMCDGLKMNEIGMITFTNAATNNMVEKLQTKFMELYQSTGQQKFIGYLEQLSGLQIATIDSFFKNIISEESIALGYGADVAIRSYLFEKKQIVQDIVNDLFLNKKSSNFLRDFVLPINDYTDLAVSCWDTLNNRGYFLSDIKKMQWGKGSGEKANKINDILPKILIDAENKYHELKMKNNAFAMSDIKEDMSGLANATQVLSKTKLKFLFVDEFQDTDNSQIKVVAWLKKILGCQLFVVGDVKQSIYRFRGAEESAFDELKRCLIQTGTDIATVKELVLSNNYRTSSNVLLTLNKMFRQWGTRHYLTWDYDVVPQKKTLGRLDCINYKDKKNLKEKFLETIKKLKNLHEKDVCVLARNNSHVKTIALWCHEAGIACLAKEDGGFYHNEAVLDFLAALSAMIYPSSSENLFNFIKTPYIDATVDYEQIKKICGNEEKLVEYFNGLLPKEWHEFIEQLRKKPAFIALKDFIDLFNPLSTYKITELNELQNSGFCEEDLNQQLSINVQTYELNLNKLIKILYEYFTGDFVSVLNIYDFLSVKVKTNAEEEVEYPNVKNGSNDFVVNAMTVHKAKGLEFGTVLITHMNTPFIIDVKRMKKFKSYITQKEKKKDGSVVKIGWCFKSGGNDLNNDFYTELLSCEEKALCREEARILYVALTRCKNNIIYFVPNKPYDNTWATFMTEQ